MDPYRILGVPRGCTREEAKAAFRVGVQLAHPDHGGEDVNFIKLRTAYRVDLGGAGSASNIAA